MQVHLTVVTIEPHGLGELPATPAGILAALDPADLGKTWFIFAVEGHGEPSPINAMVQASQFLANIHPDQAALEERYADFKARASRGERVAGLLDGAFVFGVQDSA